MAWGAAAVAASTLWIATAEAGSAHNAAQIRWNGEEYSADELPASLGDVARTAVEAWSQWADENGYRLELDQDRRVMLVVESSRRSTKKLWSLVDQGLELLDELIPSVPAHPLSGRSPIGDNQIAKLSNSAAPSTADALPGPRALVLFELHDGQDYAALLDAVAEQQPYLADWVQGAKSTGGFTLERPLIAGWVENGAGREEWNPANELVHRLAHMYLLERYSQLPFWLTTGLVWQIEQEVCGDIYSFPYRDGFVGVVEHDGWRPQLKSAYKKAKQPVSMETLTSWTRGRYDDQSASHSWGTGRFLVHKAPEALPGLLADFSRQHLENSVVHHGDGTWTRLPDYRIPTAEQEAIFARHLGADFLEQLTDSFKR